MSTRIWWAMLLLLGTGGLSLAQQAKTVTIPGDAWTAYDIPEAGSALQLNINRANDNLVIDDSEILLQDSSDTVQWYRSSASPASHIYNIGTVLSAREYLHVFGHFHYTNGVGGGGGTLPTFNAKVAAPDVDVSPLTEEQEESFGVWIPKGCSRKALTMNAVACRVPGSQQTLTWSSGKVSLWTAASGGSILPGGSKSLSADQSYTYYAQGINASGSIRDSEIKAAYTVSGQGTAYDKVKLTVVGATITPFDTILLNATNDVTVTLAPNPPGITSTVQIVCLTGSGSAVFVPSGSTSSNITQSATMKIKGVTASSAVSNMMLKVMLGADVLASNTFTVVGLQEPMKYKIGTNTWADMPDPLYVCKDTTVDFKAIKSPTNASWPGGKPVWGGMVSGSGMESKSYTFSTISTSAADYKIVSAECGNTVTGKVIVTKVSLKSIDFLGSGNHTLRKEGTDTWENDDFGDDGNVTINYPEWQDCDLDGVADTNEPACYIKYSAPKMTAVLAITPNLTATVPAKLRIKEGTTVLAMKDINLSGTELSVPDIDWGTNIPNALVNTEHTLDWEISLDVGSSYCEINTTDTRLFVIYSTPIQQNSFSSASMLTCKRISEVLNNSGTDIDVSSVASNLMVWRDDYGIDNTGVTTGSEGSKIWALLDLTEKGQCAEGSLLMEQAARLLGITAEYQHVLPSINLPINVHTAASPGSAPTRTHCSTTETLYLYFVNAGDFTGWNVGEGCCLVGTKLYAAWAGYMIGEAGGVVGGKTAASAAHHILLQLENGMPNLQRWRKENGDPCDDGDTEPIP